MPKLNDDLFTEILNQDEKYKSQRKSNFNFFNQKIAQPKTNQNKFLSWFNFTQNRLILVEMAQLILVSRQADIFDDLLDLVSVVLSVALQEKIFKIFHLWSML